ncbi:DUF5959 family protein [Streptomyces olivochromogenes]|uniref:DUF5959 family protein n=1 Tax=Streptomyces olivochromogenes TaxID=1963 RepID=UPI001F1C039A|nr:DUF5959 family protein [Streptomyces olivochromogenes]MCF3128969.1 hypothetical protein [Streptomyces olivochromogenes]
MAEESIDLIRLEGGGNTVILRITGKETRQGLTGTDVLAGEFHVDTPFVRGSLRTGLLPEDLRQWQQALDMPDAGHDVAWREGTDTWFDDAYRRLDLTWETWSLKEG